MKKYELTDETLKIGPITLHRVKALVAFTGVEVGEPGGWVEKEANLDQSGNKAIEGVQVTTMDGQVHDVGRWDLLIAHPPCTYLTAASAVRLFNSDHSIKDWEREQKGWYARRFFLQILSSGVERIAVENPCSLSYFRLPKYSQIIEPYMFGDPWKKRTCLWLVNLPPLEPSNVVEPLGLWVGSTSGKNTGTGRIRSGYTLASNRDQKTRSKTFPGIAAAMADQWG